MSDFDNYMDAMGRLEAENATLRQTEAAMRRRLEEVVADCERLRQQLGMPLETERENERLRARLAEYEAKDGQRTREHNLLVRENREQAARLAEAERDAARYRWLRHSTQRVAQIHVDANVRNASTLR